MTHPPSSMQDILQGLNEAQREVVTTTHGPLLVLAGAGSGKTRALTHRIAYLIQQRLARPDQIFAVTFTNKAAKEMKERVSHLVQNRGNLPQSIGTFHSLGVRILREQSAHLPRQSGFLIFDTSDSERCIRQAMDELKLSKREWGVSAIRNRISRAKNDFKTPAQLMETAGSMAEEVTAQVYARYQHLLARYNAYDFDDLILEPIHLLANNPSVQAWYHEKWQWLLVDEYQDTNPAQDKWLHLLSGPQKNVCVVGDDYQAIYSWRGADVSHILKFEHSFPGCKTIFLTQNYRSTPAILSAANEVISRNETQMHKTLWTEQTSGAAVEVRELPSDRAEARWIREEIQSHVREGGKLADFFVLYRTNAQSRAFEEEFLMHAMPYTIVGGWRFYERREVKDALAFLQFWVHPTVSLPLQRIADTLWRGVGAKTIVGWEGKAEKSGVPLFDIVRSMVMAKPVLAPFVRAYTEGKEQTFATVADLLRHLLETSGYIDALRREPDGEERIENIQELFNVTSVHIDPIVFLEEVALLTDLDQLQAGQDRVTCMTLHAAKGLEAPRVFLAGVEEGILPHINSVNSKATLEEERRLLYVGITRAREKLCISFTGQRFVNGQLQPQAPSRFLDDLPADVVRQTAGDSAGGFDSTSDVQLRHDETPPWFLSRPSNPKESTLATGQFVQHGHFGQGVVIESQGDYVMCVFQGHGIQKVSAQEIQSVGA